MRISDWSSDVCSSDLRLRRGDEGFHVSDALLLLAIAMTQARQALARLQANLAPEFLLRIRLVVIGRRPRDEERCHEVAEQRRRREHEERDHRDDAHEEAADAEVIGTRSEEHTSEIQSLMRYQNSVDCL